MSGAVDRRTFLRRAGVVAGSLAFVGPLQALAERMASGAPLLDPGYGSLVNRGDLWLPRGFQHRVISRQGDLMSDGAPTPSRFDGMAAFAGHEGSTVLIRNHENKRRFQPSGSVVSPANEIDVEVPAELRYDPAFWNGGVTKLVVEDRVVTESYAVLGGTSNNCAGGPTPWGSWITCEEIAQPPPGSGTLRHGYIFEVDAYTTEPVLATAITAAGRFEHEAVAWLGGILYETEDRQDASFYRFTPSTRPARSGDLAAGGILEALIVDGMPTLDTRSSIAWPGGVGASHHVSWVQVPNPDPADDRPAAMQGVRFQAQALGGAIFARTEGCWAADDGKVYFDCTNGGGSSPTATDGNGQIFALDPANSTLTLVYQSPLGEFSPLIRPDNMVMAATGDLFLCEDHPAGTVANHIRGLTPDGGIFDFARAETNPTEFCGACFDEKGLTMYVNQQGNAQGPQGVTYAIWGPWKRNGHPGQ
jgi:secreted PhoX family phosphatase